MSTGTFQNSNYKNGGEYEATRLIAAHHISASRVLVGCQGRKALLLMGRGKAPLGRAMRTSDARADAVRYRLGLLRKVRLARPLAGDFKDGSGKPGATGRTEPGLHNFCSAPPVQAGAAIQRLRESQYRAVVSHYGRNALL